MEGTIVTVGGSDPRLAADRPKDAWELADRYKTKHPNYHFFDRSTLKFFGERMSEMRVLKDPVSVVNSSGDRHTCWVLSSLQRKHPDGPTRVYHYFDTETYNDIIPKEEWEE